MSGDRPDLLALAQRANARAQRLSWWTWPKKGQELTPDDREKLYEELNGLASGVVELTRESVDKAKAWDLMQERLKRAEVAEAGSD